MTKVLKGNKKNEIGNGMESVMMKLAERTKLRKRGSYWLQILGISFIVILLILAFTDGTNFNTIATKILAMITNIIDKATALWK